jgi:3-hydroxyacyl-[acyl-carrier-protein] dehydratase
VSARDRARPGALALGSNVVELLLPQRRPMLMVDRIEAFEAAPRPALEASRHVSANELFFEGHFPGLHLWPGCLTIEGMGQTAQLLVAVLAIRALHAEAGGEAGDALAALANLERGFTLHPAYDAARGEDFLRRRRELGGPSLALGAAVDVKLLGPVFAGQKLDYRAELEAEHGDLMRFRVEAATGGVPVARGTMTGSLSRKPIPRAAP